VREGQCACSKLLHMWLIFASTDISEQNELNVKLVDDKQWRI